MTTTPCTTGATCPHCEKPATDTLTVGGFVLHLCAVALLQKLFQLAA